MPVPIESFRMPRYQDIPDVGLYLDQTVKYINRYLEPLGCLEITASMVSNYVKRGYIANPVKKQYDREQIAYLLFLAIAKSVLPMEHINRLFAMQKQTYSSEVAYNYFCVELEKALQATFSTRDFSAPSSANRVTPESELVRSSALCFANKMFSMKYLEYVSILWKEQDAHPQKP